MGLAQLFTAGGKQPWSAAYVEVLEAFEEVSLLSTREEVDLDDVLRLVGRRLCELLQSSRCSVYLRQSDGIFRGQVGFVANQNIDASIRKLVAGVTNDHFTEEIVNTAKPVIVRDALTDPRPVRNIMRRWGVRSMLGVPLVVDGDVIGVIFVDDENTARPYSENDAQMAQAFAGLAALVVRQSWFQKRLRDNASVMEQQRTALSESSLIHSRVTKAVLDGAKIDEIVSLIASLLRLKAVLYTPELDVLAWSSADGTATGDCPALTKSQASLEVVQSALRGLRQGEASFMIRATRELGHRRLIAPLLVDRQCVGYLELSESGSAFNQVHRRAIEQAAMALALSTLATQRSEVLRRQERELYFSDLIYGRRDAKGLIDRASDFGVDVDRVHNVLLLRLGDGAEVGPTRTRGRRDPVDIIESQLPDSSHIVASSSIPGAELMLIETDQAGEKALTALEIEVELTAQLTEALPELAKTTNVRFGVLSETCRQLLDVAGAAKQTRQVSSLLSKGSDHPRFVTTRSFALLRLIGQRTGLSGAVEYSNEILAPLLTYDAAHNTQLEVTLRTFVACDAQLRRTAQELGIHENTVRYRLGKVRDISGLSPDRLESLARVAVAFQVQELLDPTAASSESASASESGGDADGGGESGADPEGDSDKE